MLYSTCVSSVDKVGGEGGFYYLKWLHRIFNKTDLSYEVQILVSNFSYHSSYVTVLPCSINNMASLACARR